MKYLALWVMFFWGYDVTYSQNLRYFGSPAEVFQGDQVIFSYLETKAGVVPFSNIASWRWDFDGDVVDLNNPNDPGWDQNWTVGQIDPEDGQPLQASDIDSKSKWIAAFDESQAVDGVYRVTPTLQVTLTPEAGGMVITQTGVTENVIGPAGVAPDPDTDIAVRQRSAGNLDLSVAFSVSPRMATAEVTGPPFIPAQEVRLFSTVTPAQGRTLDSATYLWEIDHLENPGLSPADQTTANPTLQNLPAGSYSVALTVTYTVSFQNQDGETLTQNGSLTDRKYDFFRVVEVPQSLQLGRAYRRGFPDTLGWPEIIEAYQALGVGNNRYVYFQHFEDAFFDQQAALAGENSGDTQLRADMAEILNELLQGQTLIANDRLVKALRIKYPRLAASVDPEDASQRLNPPAGARTETAAIDQALLDYQLPLWYLGTALQTLDSDILRTKAPFGAEPFPQFPQYLTFTDPSLSQGPIPIRNEYWQLSTLFERAGLGRMEKAKKLWRLSVQEADALEEAKRACKVTGHQSYLAMALLAAGQEEGDFAANEGNAILAHVSNARSLFRQINEGVNPLGNDGSFIPNESFAAIYQDAQEAVADAREAEVNARQEERTWDRYQAELRSELLTQRNNYLTPLKNLTGIDPALYNNLNTVDDQRDYRQVVNARIQSLLVDYPNADPAVVGELGQEVINVLDSQAGVQQAVNNVDNLFKRIDIVNWQNGTVQDLMEQGNERLLALDVAYNTAVIIAGTIFSGIGSDAVSNAKERLANRALESAQERIRFLQSAAIANVNADAEIRGILLELENANINIGRSRTQVAQAQLRLDNQLARMDRLIEDLAHTRETAADLYFLDPSFRVVVSDAMRRAEAELDFAVDRLYRLAKTLQYEWTEPYRNPVTIPVNSFEDASLENPLFDQFTQLDSLFFVRGADEAKDYLDALKAWDSKLRRINVTSVRGPNHSGPISAEPISLREDILNLKPDPDRGYTLNDSIRDFRNFLETRRVQNIFNLDNPSMEMIFQTTIEDNRFFPATGSRWNMRVHSIAVDVFAESGFSDVQVAEIDLIQTGTVSLRRFFADPPFADDVMKLTFNAPDLDRSAFAIVVPAKINGANGGRNPAEFENLGLKGRPVAATDWVLRMDTEGPTNDEFDFSKIKDIVIRFTYTYGNPPEFPGF